MGSTVVRGEVEATVEFTGIDTFFGKTASLLADTGEISHLQKVLMKIMMILVGFSVTLCLINFAYLMIEGESLKESLSFVSLSISSSFGRFVYTTAYSSVVLSIVFFRHTCQTIVLLVASIPLAIEIVTNTTLAIGSKSLSHHGAIVARLSAIEDLAGMSILCSDKVSASFGVFIILHLNRHSYDSYKISRSILITPLTKTTRPVLSL
jgi:H+-transporting ATPase